jgi:hypothetical protein
MRALLVAAGLALLLGFAPPAAAAAAGRLDVLAQTLREQPLAIDSELAWFFDAAQERRLVRTLRRSPVAFHVAVLPQIEDDESGGDGARIVIGLHRRLRRPGVYLVVDEQGYFDIGSYAVPREVSFPFDLRVPPTGRGLGTGGVVERVQQLVAAVAAAPPGHTTDEPSPLPLKPYENFRLHRYGQSTGDAALGAAVTGGILGLFAGGVARLRARRQAARAKSASRRRGRRRTR